MQTELYRHFDNEGRLLCVGISWSAVVRYGAGHRKTAEWASKVTKMTVERFPSRWEAEAAEREAIRTESPLYNRQHVFVPAPVGVKARTGGEPYLFPDAHAGSGWANDNRTIVYAPNGVEDAQLAFWGAHPAHVFRVECSQIERSARRGDWVVQIGKRLSDRRLAALRWEGVTCVVA